ncbi:MAG: CRISPR-associated protein [Chloroflexi bacterium]|nr:CRISPR-associated protein [Chloroflexota bacterium]
MFSRAFNELTVTFDLLPDAAPLLIKSGLEAGADPTLLDLNFVRSTDSHTGKRTVFLPGSSLKGAIRSHCERIARTVRPNGGPTWCCDPFDSDKSCGRRTKDIEKPAERYQRSCLACRTFGNTRMGSHAQITDAFPVGEVRREQRDGVAIDRVSGAVAAGPFNLEVVTAGRFRATLTLRNFQLWQMGWLAVALRDLGAGRLPLGSGKSKGFGRMKVEYGSAAVSYPGQLRLEANGRNFGANLYDLSAFGVDSEYDLARADPDGAPLPSGGTARETGEMGRVTTVFEQPEAVDSLLRAAIFHWRAMVESGWGPGGRP